jgi:hypothetical protein
MPSLRDVAHDGALSTLVISSVPVVCQGTLGHSTPASQAVRRVGPALYSLRPHWSRLTWRSQIRHLLPAGSILSCLSDPTCLTQYTEQE